MGGERREWRGPEGRDGRGLGRGKGRGGERKEGSKSHPLEKILDPLLRTSDAVKLEEKLDMSI